MSHIQVCLSYLSNLESRLRTVELDLARISVGAAPTVPSTPEVNKELSKLSDRWSGRRREMSEALNTLADGVRGIRQAFEEADRSLAQELALDGGGTSGGSQAGPGSSATAAPTSGGPGGTPSGGSSVDYSRHFSDGSGWLKSQPRAGRVDAWGFYDAREFGHKGNCTSFVAWRLNQLADSAGVEGFDFRNRSPTFSEGGRLGNANQWLANARPQYKSDVPRVGSVAVTDGHVAIVTKVNPDGTYEVEDSSWPWGQNEGWAYRPSRPPSRPALGFLHFLP